MGHASQEVLTYEESQDTNYYNDVQEGEEECDSNEYILGMQLVPKIQKKNMNRRNFIFNLAVHLMKISQRHRRGCGG